MTPTQEEAQAFLDDYTARYLELSYEVAQAEWASNTRIVEGDTTNAERTKAAHAAYAEYTGSADVIEATRGFLDQRDQLTELQVRQLEAILYDAANNPATAADLVEQRIAAETQQTEDLYGFSFAIDGQQVSANTIDDRLTSSDDHRRAPRHLDRLEGGRQGAEGRPRNVSMTLRHSVLQFREPIRRALRRAPGSLPPLKPRCRTKAMRPSTRSMPTLDYTVASSRRSSTLFQPDSHLRPLRVSLGNARPAARLIQAPSGTAPALGHWPLNRCDQDFAGECSPSRALDLDSALQDLRGATVVDVRRRQQRRGLLRQRSAPCPLPGGRTAPK